MADFRMFDVPTGLVKDDALAKLVEMLADVPEAQRTFQEHYGGAHLAIHGSPARVIEHARTDRQVKDVHGTDLIAGCLVLVVAEQQRRIAELEAVAKTAKPTKATTKAKPKAPADPA
jgi:hypothetical protein